MKIISYIHNDKKKIGHLIDSNSLIDISSYFNFNNMIDFITNKEYQNNEIINYISSDKAKIINTSEVKILAPINPRSLRDAYAFRQHVETSRRNRGLDMIKEFDDFPVYYYSNADGVVGPGDLQVDQAFMNKLDFELEIAILISKEGKNIPCNKADEYIAGMMIMNDFSARDLQMSEMKLNLGPAKGKDFATSIGPSIVTLDELKENTIKTEKGNHYSLKMECFINNKKVSEDNLDNISWTFAQIIERISMGTRIYPGDVIGSGTCATGCFLELNQNNNERWLKKNDVIELKVEKLGSLKNKII